MTEREADKALRDLFKEAGSFSAPAGLEARILQHIAVLPKPALAPSRPLLPNWTWFIAVPLAIGLVLFPGFNLDVPALAQGINIDWKPLFGSPWLRMGLGAGVALLALDAWLNRQRPARHVR